MTSAGGDEPQRLTIESLLAEARDQIDRLEPAEVAVEVERGAVVVDTRCQDDRRGEGTIRGAVHIPRTVLEWRADPLPVPATSGSRRSIDG